MTNLHARLREDLTVALRERDRKKVRVLRTVLSAIANAEAQPASEGAPAPSDGPIAGASLGVGATEVARHDLDAEQVRAIVRTERDERVATGRRPRRTRCVRGGRPDGRGSTARPLPHRLTSNRPQPGQIHPRTPAQRQGPIPPADVSRATTLPVEGTDARAKLDRLQIIAAQDLGTAV